MTTETQIQQAVPGLLQKGYDNPPTLYRIDGQGIRYYYTVDNGAIAYYPSTTSILASTMPMPYGLKVWYANMGWEEANRVLRESASYGTLMHVLAAEYLMTGAFDLGTIDLRIDQYREENGIAFNTDEWSGRLCKDLLAFAQFCEEKNLKVIAIEIPLASSVYRYAGCIDIVAEIDFNKKRHRVIIDMKSGRKGFFETHEIQLHAYRTLWNENYPDQPVELVFNWAPKDWEKSPTFAFENQTSKPSQSKWPLLLALYGEGGSFKPKPFIQTAGLMQLGKPLDDNYTLVDIDDMLTRKHLGSTKAKADQEVADAHAF